MEKKLIHASSQNTLWTTVAGELTANMLARQVLISLNQRSFLFSLFCAVYSHTGILFSGFYNGTISSHSLWQRTSLGSPFPQRSALLRLFGHEHKLMCQSSPKLKPKTFTWIYVTARSESSDHCDSTEMNWFHCLVWTGLSVLLSESNALKSCDWALMDYQHKTPTCLLTQMVFDVLC